MAMCRNHQHLAEKGENESLPLCQYFEIDTGKFALLFYSNSTWHETYAAVVKRKR